VKYFAPRLSPCVAFLLSALFYAGCGGDPPLPPEQRGAVYAEAFKALQEMRSHTMRAIDHGEYILRLRELDKTLGKLVKDAKADDEVKKKLDHAWAPYRAALEQWNKFVRGELGPEIVDVMPILREQWKLGWERAVELKAESDSLTAAE
jgi:hypothetical protein